MELKDLFYKWVPVWVRLSVLFLLFFVILTANGIYLGNAQEMYSDLGVYTEPYTAANNAAYLGFGLGFLVEVRLRRRFSNKTLLFWGLGLLLLMNIVCAVTNNPEIVVVACLVLGFSKVTALAEVYLIWVFIWSKTADRSRVYPFVYFTALSGTYLVTWVTTELAHAYNWRYAYIGVLILILLCMLLSLILVENHPIRRIFPLYQMDWWGLLLLTTSLMLVNYIAVYGQVEDWWSSNKIKGAMLLLPVCFLWFLRRQFTLKRPLVNLRLFREHSFRKGLLYFLLLGIFLPSSIQAAFSGGILHYEMIRNTELNLFSIPGVVAGAILCFTWYYYKQNPEGLLFAGFLAFVMYYFILYNSLGTQFNIDDFWAPSLFKGFATVVLYVVIGVYAVNKFGLDKVFTAAGMMIIVRSFIGSTVFTGLYSYFLYTGRIRHFDYIAGLTDGNDYLSHEGGEVAQPGGTAGYYRTIQEQATLAAGKEMSGTIIIIGLLILAFILIGHFSRVGFRIRHKIVNQ